MLLLVLDTKGLRRGAESRELRGKRMQSCTIHQRMIDVARIEAWLPHTHQPITYGTRHVRILRAFSYAPKTENFNFFLLRKICFQHQMSWRRREHFGFGFGIGGHRHRRTIFDSIRFGWSIVCRTFDPLLLFIESVRIEFAFAFDVNSLVAVATWACGHGTSSVSVFRWHAAHPRAFFVTTETVAFVQLELNCSSAKRSTRGRRPRCQMQTTKTRICDIEKGERWDVMIPKRNN